jgi:predicted dehydrogenase
MQKDLEKGSIGIACLGITHPHCSGRVRAMRRVPNVELLGAADDDALIEPFTRHLGMRRRSVEDILTDSAVDAVLVHSKSDSMAKLSCAALEAGKAVLVEKPAGRDPADLDQLVATAARTSGLCQVGYCYRFSPAVTKMEEALRSGGLGQVMQVRAHAACSLNEAASSHLNQPGDMGGALFVIGCHLIDLLLFHFGNPVSVNARVPKFKGLFPESSREDSAAAILNYPDKLVSIDFFSWDPLPWVESWEIAAYGTGGIMHARPLPATYREFQLARNSTQPGWTVWNESSFPVPWASQKTEYSPELAEIGNPDFFDREAAAFLSALKSGGPSPIPASHARDVVHLIDGLYRSSDLDGAEIRL